MTVTICVECGEPITKADELKANFREVLVGDPIRKIKVVYAHKHCPCEIIEPRMPVVLTPEAPPTKEEIQERMRGWFAR